MNAPIPDERTALDLGNGWRAAWCVNADGTRTPWLVRRLCSAREDPAVHGCADACCAPHERQGPPPERFTVRLDRCGRPCRDGLPCRRRVSGGGPCWQHRREPAGSRGSTVRYRQGEL